VIEQLGAAGVVVIGLDQGEAEFFGDAAGGEVFVFDREHDVLGAVRGGPVDQRAGGARGETAALVLGDDVVAKLDDPRPTRLQRVVAGWGVEADVADQRGIGAGDQRVQQPGLPAGIDAQLLAAQVEQLRGSDHPGWMRAPSTRAARSMPFTPK